MKYQVQENCLTVFLPQEVDHHNVEEIRKESDHLIARNHIKSCTYGVCAATWILSVKCIKYHDLIGRVLVVALHHGKFI